MAKEICTLQGKKINLYNFVSVSDNAVNINTFYINKGLVF
jgi:hypothetical protein